MTSLPLIPRRPASARPVGQGPLVQLEVHLLGGVDRLATSIPCGSRSASRARITSATSPGDSTRHGTGSPASRT